MKLYQSKEGDYYIVEHTASGEAYGIALEGESISYGNLAPIDQQVFEEGLQTGYLKVQDIPGEDICDPQAHAILKKRMSQDAYRIFAGYIETTCGKKKEDAMKQAASTTNKSKAKQKMKEKTKTDPKPKQNVKSTTKPKAKSKSKGKVKVLYISEDVKSLYESIYSQTPDVMKVFGAIKVLGNPGTIIIQDGTDLLIYSSKKISRIKG